MSCVEPPCPSSCLDRVHGCSRSIRALVSTHCINFKALLVSSLVFTQTRPETSSIPHTLIPNGSHALRLLAIDSPEIGSLAL